MARLSDVAALRQHLQLTLDAAVGPAAMSRRIAEVARQARADVEARQGAHPTTTIVDGRVGASEDAVRPFGQIRYQISFLGEIVQAVYAELLRRSPVGPGRHGHYRDAHWVFVNGARLDISPGAVLTDIPPGSEVTIVNVQPYARKLEKGRTGLVKQQGEGERAFRRRRASAKRAGLSVQAPDGIYEVTQQDMARRYAGLATITFTYQAATGAALMETPRGKAGRQLRFPAILISPW